MVGVGFWVLGLNFNPTNNQRALAFAESIWAGFD